MADDISTTGSDPPVGGPIAPKPIAPSRGRSFDWRHFPWVPAFVLATFLIAALFAPVLTTHDPTSISLTERLQSPSGHHWLGTDSLGRDYLTRLLFGARTSMIVVVSSVVGAGLLGLAIGIVSGYVGGWVDAVLMRLTDAFLGLPSILVAMVFVFAVGGGLTTVIIALSIVGWSRFARIIRSEVLSIRERDFVASSQVAGSGKVRIMSRQVLPNVFNTWVVVATLQCGDFVLSEASLSFLGAGVPPPTPTWGNMISEGLDYLTTAWWLATIPGVTLLALVYAVNVFGDWLRDVLDPKLRQA
jgi:peptide/nickel transport system permease protein